MMVVADKSKNWPNYSIFWGDQMPMHISARVIRLGNNPMDHLALSFEGKMYVLGHNYKSI